MLDDRQRCSDNIVTSHHLYTRLLDPPDRSTWRSVLRQTSSRISRLLCLLDGIITKHLASPSCLQSIVRLWIRRLHRRNEPASLGTRPNQLPQAASPQAPAAQLLSLGRSVRSLGASAMMGRCVSIKCSMRSASDLTLTYHRPSSARLPPPCPSCRRARQRHSKLDRSSARATSPELSNVLTVLPLRVSDLLRHVCASCRDLSTKCWCKIKLKFASGEGRSEE